MAKKYAFLLVLVSAVVFGHVCSAQLSVIKTYAGSDTAGYSGDGGPATDARCLNPSGIAIDDSGQVYFCDKNANCVRKVSTTGIITTVAGTGASGYSGDGGPATDATLYWPQGITLDHQGNLYISDQFNNTVRKVSGVTGNISTIAGDATLIGYTGDGGPATNAALWHPTDVAVDDTGNVYFVDQDNAALRKVDAGTGILTTVAGTGVSGYNGDGIRADTAQLNFPCGLTIDTAGNLYIADFYNNRVRKVNVSTGIITTVAGTGVGGYGGEGGLADTSMLYQPSALAMDSQGNLIIADYANARIRKVDMSTGIISAVAGNGLPGYSGDNGPATAGQIFWPQGVAADTAGNIYIADFQNGRIRVVMDSIIVDTAITWVTPNPATPILKCSIIPNPNKGYFSLDLSESVSPVMVEVSDIGGNRIYSARLMPGKNVIDLGDPAPGVYTLYVESGTTRLVRKLVVRE